MNKEKGKLSFWHFALLWFGAAVSIAEILTGGFIAPLGFKMGLLAIILGHLIGTSILALGGIIGTRENVPAITSTRISFGLYGSYVFSILNVLQLVGWTAIMIKSAATSLSIISQTLWGFNHFTLWCIIIGVLTVIWIAAGMVGFKKVNTTAVILLFVLTVILGWVVFKNPVLKTSVPTSGISFGAALELVVVMPISWLPLIADYTRFAKTEKQGAYGSFAGYFVGSSWMFIIGLGATIVSKNSDPSAMMLAANLGIAALGVVVLSTVTTTFMDAYSAGVTFLNITKKFSEKNIAIIMTVLGTIVGILLPIDQYTNFLYAIGSVFAPLFAVLLTDYFIVKKNKTIDYKLQFNIGAAIVWIIGVISYYVFIKYDFILGATVPSMIITAIFYIIFWRYLNKWKIIKKY